MDRYALILTPSKEMIDWVNEVLEDSPIDYESLKGHDGSDVFLIDEFDNVDEAEVWLKDNHYMFLEEMLIGWVENDELWPKELDWKLFEKFINYSIQTVVYDIAGESQDEDDLITFSQN